MSKHLSGSDEVGKLVSSDSLARITVFIDLLRQWKNVTNLTSDNSFNSVWRRHVLDSIYLQHLAPDKVRWLDFGSGSGFPGIILGILLRESRFSTVHCVESDSRKCAFLRTVVQRLEIPVKIHNTRVEQLYPEITGSIEVITARAFSSVQKITRLSESYMRTGTVLILPRGKTSALEVEALDPNLYTSAVHANPLADSGMFLQIQLRAGRR